MSDEQEYQDHVCVREQCVEYARRWLRTRMGLIYADVRIAADIWDQIHHYTRVSDAASVLVNSVLNGAARLPKTGSLLVYSEKFCSTGHVAVVCDVDPREGVVCVNEQNYANRYQAPDHVRRIPLVMNANRYWLLDSYLIGWKQVG